MPLVLNSEVNGQARSWPLQLFSFEDVLGFLFLMRSFLTEGAGDNHNTVCFDKPHVTCKGRTTSLKPTSKCLFERDFGDCCCLQDAQIKHCEEVSKIRKQEVSKVRGF